MAHRAQLVELNTNTTKVAFTSQDGDLTTGWRCVLLHQGEYFLFTSMPCPGATFLQSLRVRNICIHSGNCKMLQMSMSLEKGGYQSGYSFIATSYRNKLFGKNNDSLLLHPEDLFYYSDNILPGGFQVEFTFKNT